MKVVYSMGTERNLHENLLLYCALDLSGKIRYEIAKKNVEFYVEILNSQFYFILGFIPGQQIHLSQCNLHSLSDCFYPPFKIFFCFLVEEITDHCGWVCCGHCLQVLELQWRFFKEAMGHS